MNINSLSKNIFNNGEGRKIHLIGICGIGMAGMAFLLKKKGFNVSGCDISQNRMIEWLTNNGISVFNHHDIKHIKPDIDFIIRSAAIPLNNSEIIHADKSGIPVFSRGMVLASLLDCYTSVVVGGTHGKTTTSSFIAQILKNAGKSPSWCIGGKTKNMDVAGWSNSKTIVAEADESDGSIVFYKPNITVITNIEPDHMEYFKNKNILEESFRKLLSNTVSKIIFCSDHLETAVICRNFKNAISYGFTEGANLRGINLIEDADSLKFTIIRNKKVCGDIRIPVPGRHNALNALAAIAVAFELELNFEDIKAGLASLVLPCRRFEKIVSKEGITIISDYAHHPSEILALIQTATKLKHKRLLAIFQPHRYTRTSAFGYKFTDVFRNINKLILTPVYPASEQPLKGGMIWDLYEHFINYNNSAKSIDSKPIDMYLASSPEHAWFYLKQKLRNGDILLIIGAGDIEKVADIACKDFDKDNRNINFADSKSFRSFINTNSDITVSYNESLANKTTFRIGGSADIWMEIKSETSLQSLLKWRHKNNIPFTLIGGGSNILVSDLGIRGITVRLKGNKFQILTEKNGVITVGAGVPVIKLLNWLEKHEWSGLEFMEGIPGTVGGAVKMNAGAWKKEIGTYITRIRCLNMDGTECIFDKSNLGLRYRGCDCSEGKIVLDVQLLLNKDSSANIRKLRTDITKRRSWLKGLRSAGSVFKNPPSKTAGFLIEEAGLKGYSIGGAGISKKHANIIVARKGTTASDIIALIGKVRAEVMSETGIYLEKEIIFME